VIFWVPALALAHPFEILQGGGAALVRFALAPVMDAAARRRAGTTADESVDVMAFVLLPKSDVDKDKI